MLEALGVEPRAEEVYRALLTVPGATAVELTGLLGQPEEQVASSLGVLLHAGLAVRSMDGEYVASPPAVALGALLTERLDALRLAEVAVATLAEEHRTATVGRNPGDLVEVVTGIDAVRHRYQQVQQAATQELRSFVTAPFVAVRPGENAAEAALLSRGVRNRVVLERSVLAEPGATEELVDSLRKGVEVRVVDTLPLKLVLADAILGLVPLGIDSVGEPGAVLLQSSGLLNALGSFFETIWRQAYPLDPSSLDANEDLDSLISGPTALERQLLSLLLAGLSDQTVATQLGLSLRTVQRSLRRLQDRAGVNTRMQLGWYAARNGWA